MKKKNVEITTVSEINVNHMLDMIDKNLNVLRRGISKGKNDFRFEMQDLDNILQMVAVSNKVLNPEMICLLSDILSSITQTLHISINENSYGLILSYREAVIVLNEPPKKVIKHSDKTVLQSCANLVNILNKKINDGNPNDNSFGIIITTLEKQDLTALYTLANTPHDHLNRMFNKNKLFFTKGDVLYITKIISEARNIHKQKIKTLSNKPKPKPKPKTVPPHVLENARTVINELYEDLEFLNYADLYDAEFDIIKNMINYISLYKEELQVFEALERTLKIANQEGTQLKVSKKTVDLFRNIRNTIIRYL